MQSRGGNNNNGSSGGSGSAARNSSGSKQPEYTAEQKADRAAVTTALSEKSNIELMDKMGQSSKERRKKKCLLYPAVA